MATNLATDYSSFRGTPPTRMTAGKFVALRRSSLAELVTQHLSLNHLVMFTGEQARCRFDFVIHRWPLDTADTRFFHTFGYYEDILLRASDTPHGWAIESITQHALHSDGSPELHGAHRPNGKDDNTYSMQVTAPAVTSHASVPPPFHPPCMARASLRSS